MGVSTAVPCDGPDHLVPATTATSDHTIWLGRPGLPILSYGSLDIAPP